MIQARVLGWVISGVVAATALALAVFWGVPWQAVAWVGPFVVGLGGFFGWVGGELFAALGLGTWSLLGAFLSALLGLLASMLFLRRLSHSWPHTSEKYSDSRLYKESAKKARRASHKDKGAS